MTDQPALAVEDVVAGYGGVVALRGVSLSVRPGTITAVLGANGAGKTTLLTTISGFVRPRQGRITLAGADLTRRRPEEIARALMARPRVLLLDEPSLGLAPKIVAQVMGLIRRLRDDTGLTVLLVEQNARSALGIADRGVVLNLGKVVAAEDAAVLAADVGLRQHYLGF